MIDGTPLLHCRMSDSGHHEESVASGNPPQSSSAPTALPAAPPTTDLDQPGASEDGAAVSMEIAPIPSPIHVEDPPDDMGMTAHQVIATPVLARALNFPPVLVDDLSPNRHDRRGPGRPRKAQIGIPPTIIRKPKG